MVRGDRRTGTRGQLTNGGDRQQRLRQAGRQHRHEDDSRLRRLRGAAHLHRQHPRLLGPGQGVRRPAQGPVRGQPGRDLRPGQRPGRGRLHACRGRVPARQLEEGRRHRRPGGRERHHARARGADELPGRRRRHRDRRLDDRQPAPGVAAEQRAQERLPDRGDRRRRLDAGLAPRHAAGQRGRDRPARQGQVQRLEAEGRRPVRDLRDEPDAAGAARDRAGHAGHRADQLPAHRPRDDLPHRHRRRQPAEGVSARRRPESPRRCCA